MLIRSVQLWGHHLRAKPKVVPLRRQASGERFSLYPDASDTMHGDVTGFVHESAVRRCTWRP